MQQIQIHFLRLQCCFFECCVNALRNFPYRKLKYFLTVHLQKAFLTFCLADWIAVRSSLTGKYFPSGSITANLMCQNSGFFRSFHECRACPISK